jgi:Undecaprenyl-phosphate glucose phosphotransferase
MAAAPQVLRVAEGSDAAAASVLEHALRQNSSRRLKISDEIFGGLVACCDMLIVMAVAGIAYIVYLQVIVAETSAHPPNYIAVAALATAILLQRLASRRAYLVSELRNTPQQVKRVLAAWSIAVVLLVLAGYLLKFSDMVSRVWLVSWYAGTLVALVASRCIVGNVLTRWVDSGHFFRSAVVVGAAALGRRFVECSLDDPSLGLRVIGLFDDRMKRVPRQIRGVPVLGRVADLPAFTRYCKVDLVIIAMPLSADRRIHHLVSQLRALDVDVSVLGDSIGFTLPQSSVSYPGGVPAFDLMKRPIAGWYSVAKRGLDIGISFLALALLLPLFAAIALAIKLDDPGAALFRQKRLGFNGKTFFIYKFRTMRTEATDADAQVLVSRGDNRVTRIGAFLRRTSLDELPQLWNVLLGDMSLVGPRPHALKAKAANRLYDEVVAEYAVRHRVKPGITGWAQVKGWRGETDTVEKIKKRVEHDLYYIDNWSLAFDLRILLMTSVCGFFGRNAF